MAATAPHFSVATVITNEGAEGHVAILPRTNRVVEVRGTSVIFVDLARHRIVATTPLPSGSIPLDDILIPSDSNGRAYVITVKSFMMDTISAFDAKSGRLLSRHHPDPRVDGLFAGMDPSTGDLFSYSIGDGTTGSNGHVEVISPDGRLVTSQPFIQGIQHRADTNAPAAVADFSRHIAIFYQPFIISNSPDTSNSSIVAGYDTRTGKLAWKRSVGFPPALCAINKRTGQLWAVAPGGRVRVYDDRTGRLVTQIGMSYPTPTGWTQKDPIPSVTSDIQSSMMIDDASNTGYIQWSDHLDRADVPSRKRNPFISRQVGFSLLGTDVIDHALVLLTVASPMSHIVVLDGRMGKSLGQWDLDTLGGGVQDSASDASHVYAVSYASVAQTSDVSGATQVPALRIATLSF